MSGQSSVGSGVPSECYCSRSGTGVSYEFSAELPDDLETQTVVMLFGSRALAERFSVRELAELFREAIDEAGLAPDVLITGGAEGADAGAEALAVQDELPIVVTAVGSVSDNTAFRRREFASEPFVTEVVSEYDGEGPRSGRGAYLWRNCLMADLADAAVGLWNGRSTGTEHATVSARSHGATPTVITYEGGE